MDRERESSKNTSGARLQGVVFRKLLGSPHQYDASSTHRRENKRRVNTSQVAAVKTAQYFALSVAILFSPSQFSQFFLLTILAFRFNLYRKFVNIPHIVRTSPHL